jgi:hypothetical protein
MIYIFIDHEPKVVLLIAILMFLLSCLSSGLSISFLGLVKYLVSLCCVMTFSVMHPGLVGLGDTVQFHSVIFAKVKYVKVMNLRELRILNATSTEDRTLR